MYQRKIKQAAFQHSLPVMIALFPLGIVFGVLFTHQGYSWYLAPVMSLVIYGGAVQFVAMSLLAAGGSLASMLIAAFMLSIRNAFYGLHFLDRFSNLAWYKKLYLIHGLVDGNYAIFINHDYKNKDDDIRFCLWTTFLIQISWVGGALIGSILGEQLPDLPGMQFILVAFFGIIALDQYFKLNTIKPFTLAAACFVLAFIIDPRDVLLISILFTVILLLIEQKFLGANNND